MVCMEIPRTSERAKCVLDVCRLYYARRRSVTRWLRSIPLQSVGFCQSDIPDKGVKMTHHRRHEFFETWIFTVCKKCQDFLCEGCFDRLLFFRDAGFGSRVVSVHG